MIEFLESIAQFESLVVAIITAVTTFVAVWFRNRMVCKVRLCTFARSMRGVLSVMLDVCTHMRVRGPVRVCMPTYARVRFLFDRVYVRTHKDEQLTQCND